MTLGQTYARPSLSMKLQLPMGARIAIVDSLTEHGMSSRTIASALGVHRRTVERDRELGGAIAPGEGIIGQDGKRYPVHIPPPREPEQIHPNVTIVDHEPPPTQPPSHVELVEPFGGIDRVAGELSTLLRRRPDGRHDSSERRMLLGDLAALIEERRGHWVE